MMDDQVPILYSFRRCPYAMRARMGLAAAGIRVRLREVDLKNKPAELLAISPKGTVPVMHVSPDLVLDQSITILKWALHQADPYKWMNLTPSQMITADNLIAENDGAFKQALDLYKYPHRFNLVEGCTNFVLGLEILQRWAHLISENQGFLISCQPTHADIALFPFIRQFFKVDEKWFISHVPHALNKWLEKFLNDPLFASVMVPFKPWQAGNKEVFLF